MSKADPKDDRENRIGRIQTIVQEDYERIQSAPDPYVILNLTVNASATEISERYERYERFYRAENFQRLGDMDLTRKALDIRRAIGGAMVEIQAKSEARSIDAGMPTEEDRPVLPEVDPDAVAMGDIYFRDGMSYLRLGDFNAASDHLERACAYDPSRGIILANLAYTRFKLDPTKKENRVTTGKHLTQAASMEPDNPEVFALMARFGINSQDEEMAHRAIERLELLKPDHPGLERLKKRSNY